MPDSDRLGGGCAGDKVDAADHTAFRYPMYVVPLDAVLAMSPSEGVLPHQTLLARGIAREWNGREHCLFVSHVWAGADHPDPTFEQYGVLQRVLAALREGRTSTSCSYGMAAARGQRVTRSGAEWRALLADAVVWYDYQSVAQPSVAGPDEVERAARQLDDAISSLHAYVRHSHTLLVLAPPVRRHGPGGGYTDFSSWLSRGWTRFEALSAFLSHANLPGHDFVTPPVLVAGPDASRHVEFCGAYSVRKPVGLGRFSVDSDRARLYDAARGMFAARLRELEAVADGARAPAPAGARSSAASRASGLLAGANRRRSNSADLNAHAARGAAAGAGLASGEAAVALEQYRWLRAMRNYLLDGLPRPHCGGTDHLPFCGEADWAAFKRAYRLRGPTEQVEGGWCPLQLAAVSNNVAVARELLEQGADVRYRRPASSLDRWLGTAGQQSALDYAVRTCGGEGLEAAPMLSLLIEHGADPLEVPAPSAESGGGTRWPSSCLHKAITYGNVHSAAFLLERYPQLASPEFDTARGVGFSHSMSAVVNLHAHMVGFLHARGLEGTMVVAYQSSTELHAAAFHGDAESLRLILGRAHARDYLRYIPVRHMGRRQAREFARSALEYARTVLLERRPPDSLTRYRFDLLSGTPLHAAVANNQLACAEVLLRHGADPAARSFWGETPARLARRLGHEALSRVLLQAQAATRRGASGAAVRPLPAADDDVATLGTTAGGSHAGWSPKPDEAATSTSR